MVSGPCWWKNVFDADGGYVSTNTGSSTSTGSTTTGSATTGSTSIFGTGGSTGTTSTGTSTSSNTTVTSGSFLDLFTNAGNTTGTQTTTTTPDVYFRGQFTAKYLDELGSGPVVMDHVPATMKLAPVLKAAGLPTGFLKCYAGYTEGTFLYMARVNNTGNISFPKFTGGEIPYFDVKLFSGQADWTPTVFDVLGEMSTTVDRTFFFGVMHNDIYPEQLVEEMQLAWFKVQ